MTVGGDVPFSIPAQRCFSPSSQGFSLIELLVASTILALLLAATFQVFSGGLQSVRLGEAYTRATLLAESRLAELTGQEDLQEGVESGRYDDTYRWRTTVAPYLEAAADGHEHAALRPVVVTVDVFWDDAEKERVVSISRIELVLER